MTYNPFDKPIHEIVASDLSALVDKEVAEGYWVEYKREFPTNKKIAKSIASFANTYGGWYFIGIQADKTSNVATEVCGFDLNKVADPVAEVRDVVRSRIDPVPVFHLRLVDLGGGKGVLASFVPDRQETPFITWDGRIYRRVGDSSDPVPENDRYALDRLVSNGREVAGRFEQFCRDDRTFSRAEEGGWVKLFLSPQPLGMLTRPADWWAADCIQRLLELSRRERSVRLTSGTDCVTGNLPFNSGRLTNDSLIARQTHPESVRINSLMVEFFFDGRAKFFIPLAYVPAGQDARLGSLKSKDTARVLRSLRDSEADLLSFFDMEKLWLSIILLATCYEDWLDREFSGASSEDRSFRAAVRIEEVWRSVPFVDSDEWADFVTRFGLPVIQRDLITIPHDVSEGFEVTADIERPLWTYFAFRVSAALGFPQEMVQGFAVSALKSFTTESQSSRAQ